jgi:hypothetical protein
VAGYQLKQPLVADWGGLDRHGRQGLASGRHDDRRGMGVLVGVDPDDELDEVCQHVHGVDSLPGDDVDGSVRTDARQDGDGTRPTGIGRSSSYIRPAAPVPGRSRQRRADKSSA